MQIRSIALSHKLAKESPINKPSLLQLILIKYQSFTDPCISLYMIIVIVVLPFYYTTGYYGIATAKEAVFMLSCRILLPLLLAEGGLFLLVLLLGDGTLKEKGILLFKKLSTTDRFALLYVLALLLSFAFTNYKEEALWGADGWQMGFLPQLMLAASYFKIAHAWKLKLWLPLLLLPTSMVQFLFACMNRFGLYPVPMDGANPLFIAFIGNINWYCGYMVTILFGVVYFLWAEYPCRKWRGFLYCYLFLGFASLITQGSFSGIFTFVACMLLLLFLSAFYGRNLNSLLLVLMIFCIACCGVSLLCSLFPQTVTYPEGIPSLLTASSFPWIASVFLMILLLAIRKWSDKAFFSKILRFFSLIFLFLIAMSGIIFLALLVKNTLSPGSIGFLSRYSVFTFTPEWGSKRGATWRAGFLCFAEQPLLKKLIGIGPDCMGIYTLQDAGLPIKELLQAQFSGLTLTNTHNEWLTILLNLGILGLCGFMGMTGSACFRFFCCGIKGHGKYSHFIGACGMCVFAYTVHNLFSFQQITNVTLLFLLLGIGENCRKAEESPSPSP